MKILKIFGIVVGIHVFALVLIFANPGCSSTSKPQPAPADTATRTDASSSPIAAAPTASPSSYGATEPSASSSAAITFNPDAPAVAAPGGSSSGGRYTPTRPGTPAAGAVVSEPVTDVTPATTYTVKSGDSLWTVAKKHHTNVADLAAANNIKTNATLRPGQKLMIPGKASAAASPTPAPALNGASASAKTPEAAAPAPSTPRASTKELRHVVKSGETLGGIAKIYGVKTGDIAAANHIADPAKIRPGMELVIPGWESAAAKNGKSAPKTAAKTASKSEEPRPGTSTAVEQSAASTQPPVISPPPVPVIRPDDSAITPAPRP